MDDEEDIRYLLGIQLKQEGFDVETAGNLGECRKLLEKFQPGILFLDVMLPDGSGMDFLPECRKKFPRSTIVMMSALNEQGERIRAEGAGANAFLSKPIQLKEFNELILRYKSGDTPP